MAGIHGIGGGAYSYGGGDRSGGGRDVARRSRFQHSGPAHSEPGQLSTARQPSSTQEHRRIEHGESRRPDRQVDQRSRTGHGQSVERTRTRSVAEQSSLSLTVTTAEGDTVELSIEAQSLRQSEQSSARTSDSYTRTSTRSREDNLSVSVEVEGDLSAEELDDIQQLLATLSSGGTAPGESDTLSSYHYSYAHSREVTKASVTAYA